MKGPLRSGASCPSVWMILKVSRYTFGTWRGKMCNDQGHTRVGWRPRDQNTCRLGMPHRLQSTSVQGIYASRGCGESERAGTMPGPMESRCAVYRT